MRSTTPVVLVALALLLPLAPARADEGGTETWDRLHIAGAPAGFVHTTVRTIGTEPRQVETRTRSEVKITRMGQTLDIASTTTTLESPDGRLQRIETTSRMSAQESTTVYTFAGGKVTIATQVMGTTRNAERDVPADLVGLAWADAATRKLAGTTDATATFQTFMPDFQAVVDVTLTSKGVEAVTMHDGTSVKATRVEAAMTMAGGTRLPMAPVTWLDTAGETIASRIEVSGMLIETYRVKDEATAKATGEVATGPQPDMFLETLIQEDDPIPTSRRLEEAWIVVTKRKPTATIPDLADEGHTVTPQADGSVLVHAVRRVPPADKRGVRPLADVPAELVDALAPGSMIQSDAPEIVKIAREVVGAETCAWVAAQRLERWVEENVTVKSMGVAFGSALEACRDKEGDCTEHAVLLAALCRAAGIPARVLMGLEYVYGVWGGHAWNEVWIEGSWYPLDATNGYGFVDPLHLPMAHMVMKEGAASETVQLLSGIGSLDVDIVAVKRDGRRIQVDDPALVTSTADTYSNRVLGISFAVPAGYALSPAKRGQGMSPRLLDIRSTTTGSPRTGIRIDVMDAPAVEGWDRVLGLLKADAASAASGEVDGRASRRVTDTRGGRSSQRVLVMADGAIWLFSLQGDGDEAAFEALLESVDFDVK